MVALALVAAALAVGHADRSPVAVHGGIAFVRRDPALVDWHGHVRPYEGLAMWSPHGRYVALPYAECNNGNCESWLVVTHADGSHKRTLSDPWSRVSWSRDDSTLTYLSGSDGLVVANGDGSNQHTVPVDKIACSFGCVTHFDAPQLSPDGTLIALEVTTLEADPVQPPKNVPADLYVVPVTGGAPVAVGYELCPPDAEVAWSPDGAWLAYTSNPCDTGLPDELEVTSADGAKHGLHALTDGFAWSPRRDELTYGRPGSLVVATPLRVLHRLTGVRSSAWSPDGSRVVFERHGLIAILTNGSIHPVARGTSPTWTTHGIAWSVPRCGPTQGIWLAGRRLTDICEVDGTHGTRWPDEVWAEDQKREYVSCGAGHDIAHVDRNDVVAGDCERVVRSARR